MHDSVVIHPNPRTLASLVQSRRQGNNPQYRVSTLSRYRSSSRSAKGIPTSTLQSVQSAQSMCRLKKTSIAPIRRLLPCNRGCTRAGILPGRPHLDSDDDDGGNGWPRSGSNPRPSDYNTSVLIAGVTGAYSTQFRDMQSDI